MATGLIGHAGNCSVGSWEPLPDAPTGQYEMYIPAESTDPALPANLQATKEGVRFSLNQRDTRTADQA